MPSDILTQGLGILASGFIIFAFTNKSDDRFKIFVMIGSLIFAAHFYLLGAYAGVVVNLINAARSGFSIKYHRSNAALAVFLSIYAIMGIIICKQPVDALPFIAGSMSAVAMYKLSGIKFRLCLSVVSGCWLAYGIIFQSVGVVMTELFVQVTNASTIYRLVRDERKKTDETSN